MRIEPLLTPVYDAIRARQAVSAYSHMLTRLDRYSAYKAMRQVKLGQLLLAFCWAHVATMAALRDSKLAVEKRRTTCRKVLESLTEHWDGLTLFVNDSRIPMDNNYGERLIRGPAVGRKNYYGSGAEWSGRLAIFSRPFFRGIPEQAKRVCRWVERP